MSGGFSIKRKSRYVFYNIQQRCNKSNQIIYFYIKQNNMEINKEKHPKVFKKVDGYLGRDEIRDLYDFFDENGILVLITHESDLDWKFIIQINCNEVDFGVWYATRQDAEKGGFEKAVEIMETMLENS